MSTTTHNPAGTNGHRATTQRATSGGVPALGSPARRVRVPELAVGILVTVVFAMGAVLWHLSATEKTPVLVAAAPVARGDVLTAADLSVTYVASDAALPSLPATRRDAFVGSVALVDLEAGQLLTPSVVATGSVLSDGDGVVGLALDPGQYPSLALAAGDHVDVIATDPAAADSGGGTTVVAAGAVVHAVEELPGDRRFVSLLTARADAEAVAAVASTGAVRLVQVPS